ncbi:hypothetical protein OIDMADRAFT_20690 [Oidiodendron maius Zn]|uniref:Uncharacterized protein n=1 Tax=Oidiodendron maius (strain Zn) TaxID=913774 RepID=A0A0C3GLI0_OIDMZ|nr:hypothetical protein OIDMADRAFT_20690 [Oidiodendron maius Zn]
MSANNNLRLIDYLPCPEPSGPRSRNRRDYEMCAVAFQDEMAGGLRFDVDRKWVPDFANLDAVVSWG